MHARLLWLPLAAVIALGCSSADEIPRVDTAPTECRNSAGQTIACDITLDQAGGFALTLIGRSCDAINNEIRINAPSVPSPVVTANGCNEPLGTQWSYGTGTAFAAGTPVNLVIVADEYANPPGLRVTDIPATATTPRAWQLDFEDGADQDFNDIQLRLDQLPAD
ncbi:MAG TPA: hypothetical protein VFY20_08670 [Gemmatimonadales bacterium]|nr:hypothetical protein [Gemmatimonadales bacterium]